MLLNPSAECNLLPLLGADRGGQLQLGQIMLHLQHGVTFSSAHTSQATALMLQHAEGLHHCKQGHAD